MVAGSAAGVFLAALPFAVSSARADSVTYTIQLGNFNATPTSISSGGFAGNFNNNGSEVALYANGSGNNYSTAFETFNTSGNGNSGTARPLQIGDSFSITLYQGSAPSGFSGVFFNDSTDYSSATNYSPNERDGVYLASTGHYLIRYNGGTTIDTGISAGTSVTVVESVTSSNTVDVNVNGTTYYNLTLEGSPTATNRIQSFSLADENDNGNNNNFYVKNGSLTSNGSVSFGGNNNTATISGVVADGLAASSATTASANTLVKVGTGTITLTGANTYTGGTNVNAGTLEIGSGSTTGTLGGGTVSIASGATLRSNRSDAPTISNAINLTGTSSNANFSVATGTSATYSGALTSSGAEFWKTGAGTLVITPNSGSAGTTVSNVVNNGVLSVSDFSTSTLGSGNFFIGNGTLQYTGATTTTTRLGGFAVQAAASAIEVTNSATNLTLSQDLGGFSGGGLTKIGAGTLTLTAVNSYSGPTAVNAGTMLVNGSTNASSAVTVAGGATLGGSGTTNGTVGVSGRLSPGAAGTTGSVGTLTTGALTLASTANTLIDVNGASTFDRVVVNGAVVYGGVLTIDLGTYAPTGTTTYQLFSATSASGTFTDAASVAFDQGGYQGTFDPATGTLSVTAVPEPTTWLGGALCFGLGGWTLRRGCRRTRKSVTVV